jgi:hypothetical protein
MTCFIRSSRRVDGLALALASLLVGCDGSDQTIQALGIPAPAQTMGVCSFPDNATQFIPSIALDTAASFGVEAPFLVVNRTVAPLLNLGDPQIIANNVITWQPLRFITQWQCDVTNNTNSAGPLFLPAFDTQVPYCLSDRSTFGDIVGQDVVGATGPAVNPGQRGLAMTTIVPTELGSAVDQLFELARQTDRCADAVTGVTPNVNCANGVCTQCDEMKAAFAQLGLNAVVQGNEPTADMVKYQPFALFEGNYITGKPNSPFSNVNNNSPFYTMRLTGVLQGRLSTGSEVETNEVSVGVDFCRSCGALMGAGTNRQPRRSNECLLPR